MRVLVACEFSGTVRDAFAARGHEAMSCDLLPSETPGWHHQGDVADVLGDGWDLMVAHPPCTHLAISGAHLFARKKPQQAAALAFVHLLLDAPIPRIALENPVSIISSRIRCGARFEVERGKYGCPRCGSDAIGRLAYSNQTRSGQNKLGPSDDRWKLRSATYQGIADAMADQWGDAPLVAQMGLPLG